MPSTASLVVPPLLAYVIAVLGGITLALVRQRGRSAAWIGFDAVVLFFAFLPLPALAGFLLALAPHANPVVPWILAAALVSLPLAYLPAHLALARVGRAYRDTAHLLGLGPVSRALRVDLPLTWKALALGKILVLTRIAGEWLLVIGAFNRINVFLAAIAALALAAAIAAAIGAAVAFDRLRPLR